MNLVRQPPVAVLEEACFRLYSVFRPKESHRIKAIINQDYGRSPEVMLLYLIDLRKIPRHEIVDLLDDCEIKINAQRN